MRVVDCAGTKLERSYDVHVRAFPNGCVTPVIAEIYCPGFFGSVDLYTEYLCEGCQPTLVRSNKWEQRTSSADSRPQAPSYDPRSTLVTKYRWMILVPFGD